MNICEGTRIKMVDLNNKVALVTGGTSGIGATTAKYFRECGAKVVIAGRNVEKGERISADIGADFFKTDITNEESILSLKEFIINQYGKLDILFNNAGIYPKFNKLEETDLSQWEEVFNPNIYGTMLVCKTFISILGDNNGTVINNASIAGMQSFISGQGYAYAASKSAVIQFTKMIAKIYAKKVRINCICPGVIDTPLYFNLDREKMKERTPSGLLGKAEDVAKVVGFLASDDARFIYGAVIPVDGGMTI